MNMLGMNPISVEGVAGELETFATNIRAAAETASTELKELEWVGEDADAFRAMYLPELERGYALAEAIRSLGLKAAHEATQQRATSAQ
ncbi:MAG: hypothetical protein Q4G21_07980 [Dermabacter sp.]|nr:hypothetical protein [Dermabacter sp.]